MATSSPHGNDTDNETDREGDDYGKDKTPPGISALEWIVAIVGLVILVGMIGFLLWRAGQDRGRPPSLVLTVERVVSVNAGYVVEFSASNEGDKTAAAVTIKGMLMDGDTLVEERETTFDYVPPASVRRGGLFFTYDPAGYTLTLIPAGYREP